MKYNILVIRLLIAILERLVFSENNRLRDRNHQFLLSDASAWVNETTTYKE